MLNRVLPPQTERIYVVMRIIFGVLFAFHGIQKVFGYLMEQPPPVMSQLWIGGVTELVTGLLIAIGFLTRWAAFLASGTMAVAYFQFHWKFQFDSNVFPVINQGELAVVYCFVFLYIACKGTGSATVDR